MMRSHCTLIRMTELKVLKTPRVDEGNGGTCTLKHDLGKYKTGLLLWKSLAVFTIEYKLSM